MDIISKSQERAMIDFTLDELKAISAALMLVYHRVCDEDILNKLGSPIKEMVKLFLNEQQDQDYRRIYEELEELLKTMREGPSCQHAN